MRQIFALLCVAVMCSGCALTTASIDVPYQPLSEASPVPGADNVTVAVVATDARTQNRDRVGVKRNGYGMQMAPIVAVNDIPTTVGEAFSQELQERGFKLGQDGITLTIQLITFYNDFEAGFFSGSANSTVAFNASIKAKNGRITFTKYYEGNGVQPNIQLADGSNAQAALIKAFQSAVASAVDDPDFIQGLLKAGAAPTAK